tara:strand:+ start:1298 stop:2197 length:900 start_codon:yes stop_codon:yes gene_type:complete
MSDQLIQFSPKSLIKVNEAKGTELYTISTCVGDMPIKRLFLPFLGIGGIFVLPIMHTYMYIPLIIFFMSFILFWNYPFIIIFMNSKPLYYEDLFLANTSPPTPEININIRERFEWTFEWSLIFTNSLFTAALSDYWLYKSHSATSFIEVIGVTGGIFSLFQSMNYMNGGIILMIIRNMIDKELDDASKMRGTIIELKNIDDVRHTIKDAELNNSIYEIDKINNFDINTEDNLDQDISTPNFHNIVTIPSNIKLKNADTVGNIDTKRENYSNNDIEGVAIKNIIDLNNKIDNIEFIEIDL